MIIELLTGIIAFILLAFVAILALISYKLEQLQTRTIKHENDLVDVSTLLHVLLDRRKKL